MYTCEVHKRETSVSRRVQENSTSWVKVGIQVKDRYFANINTEASTKAVNTWKGNYQNRDKKDNNSYKQGGACSKTAGPNTPLLRPYPLSQARNEKHMESDELGPKQVLQISPSLWAHMPPSYQGSSYRSSDFYTPKGSLLAPDKMDIPSHRHSESWYVLSLKTLSGQTWISISSATVTVKVGRRQALGPSVTRRQVSGPSADRLGFLASATIMVKVGRRQLSGTLAVRPIFLTSATFMVKVSGTKS
ncbi:hypothetical protein Cgig2_029570 [Carnegiea gigantea]|uniref:Uncharacterized protein n=1 Tax=Carnegiea gigantea TaxID=171969 RepID=A0A9Q1JMC7_9CARY|nr:hypothetical protein Cgig2_029570 [Carnegiea gigantea]